MDQDLKLREKPFSYLFVYGIYFLPFCGFYRQTSDFLGFSLGLEVRLGGGEGGKGAFHSLPISVSEGQWFNIKSLILESGCKISAAVKTL